MPSIAIKEGVFKSIDLMKEHFRSLYSGAPMHYFLYDSSNLENVRSYATSSKIEIMVCTIQSITDIAEPSFSDTAKKKGKKARRVIHEPNEKTGGLSPITFIRGCRPIVIIDEPQNIGAAGEERGIKNLSPLCTLRYSATHKQYHHPVYSLNAVDASEQKLVKTIEVADASLKTQSASPYMKLLKTGESKGLPLCSNGCHGAKEEWRLCPFNYQTENRGHAVSADWAGYVWLRHGAKTSMKTV